MGDDTKGFGKSGTIKFQISRKKEILKMSPYSKLVLIP